jgi:outer membrane lipoprotein-sorting protein
MTKYLLICFLILFFATSLLRPPGSKETLKKMHDRYAGKWYKTFSFNQTTEVYRNDSLKQTETWYENIKFPNDFRIDFGNPDSGNAVIFKNDSSYFFRSGQIAQVRRYEDDLLFLLGGMYFYQFDEVTTKMKLFGYDLDKFHEDTGKGKDVYVIGAGKGEDSVNQLWVEKGNYSPVRMIKYENKNKEEAFFENHVKLGGGFTETLVHFFINDKLLQVEKYHDLKSDVEINPAIFDTENFVKLKL